MGNLKLKSHQFTVIGESCVIWFQDVDSKAEAERMTMYRCIIASIIESETAYLECLNVMLQVWCTQNKFPV